MIPHVGGTGFTLLFCVLTLAFAGIAIESALAGRWVIAVAAGVLSGWVSTIAAASLRRMRR
jgi:hypothetical protein